MAACPSDLRDIGLLYKFTSYTQKKNAALDNNRK